MKAGLVGWPGSGKTTLFNALTALHRSSDAHVHLGVMKVPDARVESLASIFLVRKVGHAEIVLVDLPGAHRGGPSAEALKALEDVDALCLVLRGFAGGDGAADPVKDLRDFEAELVAADLGVVEHRLDRLRKAHGGRTGGEYHELERLERHLREGRPLRVLALTDAERQALVHLELLSLKPLLVVLNAAEGEAGKPVPEALEAEQSAHGAEALALCATLEGEIAELPAAEQPAFLESLGLTESARDRFIHAVYHLLDLVTFFTLGEDEVRAWCLHRGDKAPRAAGKIHPEMEKTLNKIGVTHYEELVAAREKARTHLEGKEYVVRDGDLLRLRTEH